MREVREGTLETGRRMRRRDGERHGISKLEARSLNVGDGIQNTEYRRQEMEDRNLESRISKSSPSNCALVNIIRDSSFEIRDSSF